MHKEDKKFFGIIVAGIAIVVLVALFLFGHPLQKTPADKIALSYGGGPFEGAQYQKTTNPGSGLVFNGWFDKWYEYPTTQRNYIVSSTATEGDRQTADAIRAFTSDRVQTSVELIVTFKLNTNVIRKFHETIGLKYQAWDEAGWDKMLNDNFRQPLENSVQQVVRNYEVDAIVSSPEVFTKIQESVQSTLKHEVNTLLGGDYFCGPSFQIGKEACPDFKVAVKHITVPEGIVSAFQDQEASAAKIITAQNDAKAKAARAEGEKAQQEVLTASLTPQYLEYLRTQAQQECAKNSKCVLVVTPGNGGVNVNVPAG